MFKTSVPITASPILNTAPRCQAAWWRSDGFLGGFLSGLEHLVQVEASGDLTCRWRDKTGDQDDNQRQALGKVALPVHLRLVQSGWEIRAFASADGQNWGAPRMSHTASFDTTSRIGLLVCSGNTSSSTTATYDSVTVSK